MFVARFVAAAFGVVAGADLLRDKVTQQKSATKVCCVISLKDFHVFGVCGKLKQLI